MILAMLLPGAKHGYQLKQAAGSILGQDALHNNLVYPLLRRFTEKGWVTKKTVPGERGQKRHLYTLTPLGRKTLIEKLGEYSEPETKTLDGFLMRVGLFQVLTPEIRQRILDGREARLQKILHHLSGIKQQFTLDSYPRESMRFLQRQVEAELSWIGHLRRISN
jgi:DNA-binding PadR family transcriptional regulator